MVIVDMMCGNELWRYPSSGFSHCPPVPVLSKPLMLLPLFPDVEGMVANWFHPVPSLTHSPRRGRGMDRDCPIRGFLCLHGECAWTDGHFSSTSPSYGFHQERERRDKHFPHPPRSSSSHTRHGAGVNGAFRHAAAAASISK